MAKKEAAHSCSICKDQHPRVQIWHGYVTERYREAEKLGYSHQTRYQGQWLRSLWDDVLKFERNMDVYTQQQKEFDRRMAGQHRGFYK